MATSDELADALWKHRTFTKDDLRALARDAYNAGVQAGDYHEGWEEGHKAGARDAAKQAQLDAANDYEANGLPARRLLDRAEQIGKNDGD